MRMIKHLGSMDTGHGYRATYALFFCEFCEREVVRPKGNGLKTKSCGCARGLINSERQATAAAHNKRLYRIWTSIKTRCENKNCLAYKNYGGRGITICEEWSQFSSFLNWALKTKYEHGLQIDRVDNDQGYSPRNCRWSTTAENSQNRRSTKLTKEDVAAIRSALSQGGWTHARLADHYGVCTATIGHVASRRNWRNI